MIKSRIQELRQKIDEMSIEIKSIQENCSHNEYHIGTYSWRIGSYDQKRICEDCGLVLESPSNDELEEFKDEIYEKLKKEIGFKTEGGQNFIKPSRVVGQGTKVYRRLK